MDFLLLRKLSLLGHYALQVAAMIWLNGGDTPRARWRNRLLWLLGWHLTGLVEPMFLFNHIQTGSNPTCMPNDKVSQLCHTVSYSLRMPSWLPLDEWFMPLAWHIEHHMAPKLPDENLHKVAGDVQALAAKHRLPYQVVPFERALWEFTAALAAIPRARSAWGCWVLLGFTLAVGLLVRYLVHGLFAKSHNFESKLDSVKVRAEEAWEEVVDRRKDPEQTGHLMAEDEEGTSSGEARPRRM